jgi:hypothetical protein
MSSRSRLRTVQAALALGSITLAAPLVTISAQVSAALSGTVLDQSGGYDEL